MDTQTETDTPADGANPLSAMDPEMAANPQPIFKLMRDESRSCPST